MGMGAYILSVEEESPADDAGFTRGCRITHVDGHPLRDMIDWQWFASDFEIEVSYIDSDGDSGSVVLERDMGETWGFEFDGVVFDKVRTCRNACTFCFMRQLPSGMRSTLSLRDDDFRLSFLTGTFVTLTNLENEDIERIVEQRISPLRVSLHATDHEVRRNLIGRNANAGISNLEVLLDAGIEFDAQIVLVPGVNDGEELRRTLEWAYARPGIRRIGIVPLGFTKHQSYFDHSFDEPEDAFEVIRQVESIRKRACVERGYPWAYAADEFYRNAYGNRVLEMLPGADEYGDFEMFEDGIGIIRCSVDDFEEAMELGIAEKCRHTLASADAHVRYLCGEAMQPYFDQLIEASPLRGRFDSLVVENDFFGGNVNVTGLLCGIDMIRAIEADVCVHGASVDLRAGKVFYLLPGVAFNADGLTLDGLALDDIRSRLGASIASQVHIVSTNPIDYMEQIARIVESA